ncbi:plasmid pRiA4b ORF-3 family protein [Actinokineospora sp. G85]|uniref:plasmid pRiA4b ORF-3 family protein n=1 Tax=Actinokineospora sp. G85 TaxID=3406626 RepID=UPI003C743656
MHTSVIEAAPPIWRRLELPSGMVLSEVHAALLVAYGWSGERQHVFTTPYGLAADLDAGLPAADERTVTLAEALSRRTFQYRYDLGDAWDVLVRLEKTHHPDPALTYPRCTDGARAAPPEHILGGIHGYSSVLSVLGHPNHPDHAQLTEFLDADFDPELFPLSEVDAALRD